MTLYDALIELADANDARPSPYCESCLHRMDDSVTYSPCTIEVDGQTLTVCVACFEELGGYDT